MGRKQSDPILFFKQHGFIEIEPAGEEHIRGHCPFCQCDKFFVNQSTKNWDCKHCGLSGGYQKFLQEINNFCISQFIGEKKEWLANAKGISSATLKENNLGYNPITERYTFPIYKVDSKEIWNIYIYNPNAKKDRFIGTAGAEQGLIGWHKYHNQVNVIWLCEGHWDYCVMLEILDFMERENEIVLAVPGASIFKDEWCILFKNKYVFVVYDADHDREVRGKVINPGRDGSVKVFNKLNKIAREMKFLHWPENLKDGYDIRDFYLDLDKEEEETYDYLVGRLKEYPQGVDLSNVNVSTNGLRDVDTDLYTGPGIDFEDVYKGFTVWLKLKSTEILDVFYGSLLANRLPGDPVWLFIVGPSGCGKSELLLSIKNCPGIYSIDSLTPKTLVSGSQGPGGIDPSLIPQLDGQVMCLKDFTTVLEMNLASRDEIFGQLRSAYDGEFTKPFGTGTLRSYDSKFGIITGVTRVIELQAEKYTALGERFLRYQFPLSRVRDTRQAVIRKALGHVLEKDNDEMKLTLREVSESVLNHDYKIIPEMPEEIAIKLVKLADAISLIRGAIIRDQYTKDIQHKPFQEIGTRLVKQLGKLILGIGMFKGKKVLTDEEYRTIVKVARGTIPSLYDELILKIYSKANNDFVHEKKIFSMFKLSNVRVTHLLENLRMLNVLQRVNHSDFAKKYCLTNNLFKNITEAKIYE